MTVTKIARAAAVYVLTQRVIDGVKGANKDAAETLKEHFRRTGRSSYKGIRFTSTPVDYLPKAAVRAALGPRRVAELTRQYDREHLSLPGDAKPIVPPGLDRLVKP